MSRNRVLGIAASIVLVTLSVVYFIWRPIRSYRNTTASMSPTLPLNSMILIRSTSDVHVGEIVTFRYPLNPKVDYVKRIVAGPNDDVEIRDKKLFVNGHAIDEPYAVHEDEVIYPRNERLPEPYRSRDQFGPFRVPANSWFVLGDNRDRSSDSRYWGAVPAENVIGRVIYVFKH